MMKANACTYTQIHHSLCIKISNQQHIHTVCDIVPLVQHKKVISVGSKMISKKSIFPPEQ